MKKIGLYILLLMPVAACSHDSNHILTLKEVIEWPDKYRDQQIAIKGYYAHTPGWGGQLNLTYDAAVNHVIGPSVWISMRNSLTLEQNNKLEFLDNKEIVITGTFDPDALRGILSQGSLLDSYIVEPVEKPLKRTHTVELTLPPCQPEVPGPCIAENKKTNFFESPFEEEDDL